MGLIDIGIKGYQQASLGDLLKTDAGYVIPYFQREYSWTKDDWSDFLEDIFKTKGGKGHFFGFMTFKCESNKEISVIEGQQRLTTVTILLAVIRDIFFSLKDNYYEKLDEQYINTVDHLSPGTPPYPKIVLSELNKAFFKKYIQAIDTPENKIEQIKNEKKVNLSNLLIAGCYEYFFRELSERARNFSEENRKTFLIEILSTVLKCFVTITTEVTDTNAAFNIFQTLNDRGLDLATSDLLKIYLLEKAAESWKEAKEAWDEIKEVLSTVNINGFLRHYWLSSEGVVKENELLREIEKKVKSKSEIFNFLENLRGEAENYEALLNPTVNYWENKQVVTSLNDLQILSIQMSLPYLLAICKHFSRSEFIKAINVCTNAIFRYLTIAEKENKLLERIFSAIAIDVRSGKIKNVNQISAILRKDCLDDDTFTKLFSKKQIKKGKVAKYILQKVENFVSGEKEKFSEKITLEHILPINPDEKWKGYLEKNKVDKEDWVNKIGNMTLLLGTVNKKAQNHFFTEKRDEFYKKMTKLLINDSLKNIKSWLPDDIEKRQTWLAEQAIKIWKV